MWFSLLQKVLFLFFYCELALQVQGHVIKRSPLEFGYVTFPNEVERQKNAHVVRKSSEEDAEKPTIAVSDTSSAAKIHSTHVWVPGHIRDHSFIPAHSHHIYVPVVVTGEVEEPSLLVKSEDAILFYPKHYGGFGLGSYSGGQGAGHGYQIVFND